MQRGEVVEDQPQPVIRRPWARQRESVFSLTQILFGANVAVFIAMLLASGNPAAFISPTHEFSPQVSIHFGANYGPLTLSGDWWRLFTYMFLHGSLLHIGFNMWCLWDLGALCESLYGRWTFLAIYVITGIGGGLASIAWNPGVWSVGASGAIFGLAGALIASFYLGEFSLPRAAISGTLRSLLFFAGFNLVFGAAVPGIDNSCHIGGLISGLALGAVIARLAPHSDAAMRRAMLVGLVAVVLAAAGFGVRQWRGGPMREARAFQEFANRGDSVAQLETLVRKQPNLVAAHLALAQAYYTRQQFPQAEAEFKRVLELQPKNDIARFNLAMTYLSEKRYDDTKNVLSDMLARNANDGDAHYGMGLMFADQQNYPAAIDEYKKAIDGGTRISGIYFELGNAYAKLNKYDDAIAAYEKEKQKDGDDPDVETALADAYQAKGMTQQAQDARNRAAQLKAGH
ncbi:MAG TPA: rhomboid family intramembrane serine protease [Candidatus Sulfotelmatobacter sp.]|nr:rhomboid family intramembrane serine protease [Candidatus Sulfotelmatobacter sp.]